MPKLSQAKRDALFKNGPFSRFATRIDVAFVMGAISETMRQDLNALKELRNEFAHPTETVHLELNEMKNLLRDFQGYEPKVDSFAFFKKKTDEMWAELNPLVQNAMLIAALRGDLDTKPTRRKKRHGGS